jgi:hypothetical protein
MARSSLANARTVVESRFLLSNLCVLLCLGDSKLRWSSPGPHVPMMLDELSLTSDYKATEHQLRAEGLSAS